jgi:hypothetical protein
VHALLLIGVALGLSLVVCAVVTALKGRLTLLLAAFCLLFPLLWYGAVAPAEPGSWWARRFYGEEKLARARAYQDRWARRFAS